MLHSARKSASRLKRSCKFHCKHLLVLCVGNRANKLEDDKFSTQFVERINICSVSFLWFSRYVVIEDEGNSDAKFHDATNKSDCAYGDFTGQPFLPACT